MLIINKHHTHENWRIKYTRVRDMCPDIEIITMLSNIELSN